MALTPSKLCTTRLFVPDTDAPFDEHVLAVQVEQTFATFHERDVLVECRHAKTSFPRGRESFKIRDAKKFRTQHSMFWRGVYTRPHDDTDHEALRLVLLSAVRLSAGDGEVGFHTDYLIDTLHICHHKNDTPE